MYCTPKDNNEAANSIWNDIGDGKGSQAKKRQYLFAWLKDPTWGKQFVNTLESLTVACLFLIMSLAHHMHFTVQCCLGKLIYASC